MTDFNFNGDTYDKVTPFVIAEIGVNHGGSLELAKSQIELAAKAGAHAAKFQTYKADTLASKKHSPAYWDTDFEATKSQHELFSKLDAFEFEDFRLLARHCEDFGIEFMSTPFSFEAVQELSFQNIFKVASADLTNVPLRRSIAALGKHVILSTGGATLDEVEEALDDILAFEVSVTLMHCVLNYPTTTSNANLRRIPRLIERFGSRASVGYSDHVRDESGLSVQLTTAIEQGACVIEKHFTHDKGIPGNDHYHSMDADELRLFTEHLKVRKALLSRSGEDYTEDQLSARLNARRRLFLTRPLMAGTTLSEDHLLPLRSSIGTEVARWDDVIGRVLLKDKGADEPLYIEDLRI